MGFRSLFVDAHRIAGIDAGGPAGTAALLRILTALTYRVTGLDDPSVPVEHWHRQRAEVLAAGAFDPARVGAYFDEWGYRFDLFDVQRPWRQEPRLAQECTNRAGLNTLLPERPSGNNATWFSPFHDGDPGDATISEAVAALLGQQFFGPLGRCSTRTLPGEKGKADFTYLGPLRARVSYHPAGPTLLHTLLAHLVPPVTMPFAQPPTVDLAEWETPALPDPRGPKPSPKGIVSLLANDSGHAVLLVPGTSDSGDTVAVDAYLSWRFKDKTAGNLVGYDPYLSYRTDSKRGRIAQMADAERHVWRDLPVLLADEPGTGFAPPAVMGSLAWLPTAVLRQVRMAAHGFDQHGFQPSNLDWYSAVTPPVFDAIAADPDDPTAHQFRTAIPAWVAAADQEAIVLSRAMYWALVHARNLSPKDKQAKAWQQAAAPRYWQAAYTAFDRALTDSGESGAAFAATVPDARATLRRSVIDIYDQVSSAVTDARGISAVIKHRPRTWISATETGEPRS